MSFCATRTRESCKRSGRDDNGRRQVRAVRASAAAAWIAALSCLTPSCALLRETAEHYPPYVTASGLSVQELTLPEGIGVDLGQEVTVHYEGRLEDGEVFDSSYELGQPVILVLGESPIPPGLEEGLVGMVRGGKRRLILTPELAYGEAGVEGRVPGNAIVVYIVELLDFR